MFLILGVLGVLLWFANFIFLLLSVYFSFEKSFFFFSITIPFISVFCVRFFDDYNMEFDFIHYMFFITSIIAFSFGIYSFFG